ncbi:MAG: hypothetical protein PHI18_06505, partial [bacterium]|nr:hypothetical protein [bacterium]
MARFLLISIFIPVIALADTLSVNTWLTAWRPAEWPLFADPEDVNVIFDGDVISFESLRPREGERMHTTASSWGTWKTSTNGAEWEQPSYGVKPNLGYAAAYLNVARYAKVAVDGACPQPFALFVDGKEIIRATDTGDDSVYRMSEEITLARGKSLLLAKVILHPESEPVLHVTPPVVKLTVSVTAEDGVVWFSTDPRRTLARYEDFTVFDGVSTPVISPDGLWLACVRNSSNGTTKKESWLEVWGLQRMNRAFVLRPVMGIGNVTFAPSRNGLFFYSTSGENGSDIWSHSMLTGETKRVKRDVDGLVKLVCTRGDPVLYYTADAEAKENENDWTLYDDLEDRLGDFTRTRALYALNAESGASECITATEDSFAMDEFAMAPDRDMLLFTRRVPQLERPYFTTEFWTYYPATGEARKVLAEPLSFETRPLSLVWLPGGEQVAFVSAAYFTETGDTLDRNTTQTALWRLNVNTGELRNLTEHSVFSINEDEERGAVRWNENDRTLWFAATIGGRNELFRVDPTSARPEPMSVDISRPFVDQFDLSAFGTCAFIASGPQQPPALFVRLSGSERETQQRLGHRMTGPEILVNDPNETLLPDVELASVEPWNFINEDGNTIEGWLYYPSEYKPELSRSWPLIVYFYGGVSPRDMSW